jgi:hypothetical protein
LGRAAPASKVASKDKKEPVEVWNKKIAGIVNKDLKNVASPSSDKVVEGFSPRRTVSFSPKTGGGSGHSKERSKSNERQSTSNPRSGNYKKGAGASKSRFNKNL